MSTDTLSPRLVSTEIHQAQPRGLPLARWGMLVACLIAEIALLTIRFDSGSLGNNSAWWAVLLGQSGRWLHFGITAVSASLLICGPSLWNELRRLQRSESMHARSVWLLCHLVAFAALYALTAVLLEGNLARFAWAGAAFLLWLLLGGLTIALLALAVLPATGWLALVRRCGWGLALSSLIGLLACALSDRFGELWQVLAGGTLWVVQGLLHLIYGEIVSEPTQFVVGTPAFAVQISPECAGYEGVGLILAFTAVYLVLFRERLRFPWALLLLPLGAVLIWLTNAVRLTLLIILGSAGWQELALGGFHSQAGWLAVNLVAVGLVAGSGSLGLLKSRLSPRETVGVDPTLAYLGPFLVLLAARMVSRAFSTSPEELFPLCAAAALAALWCFRRSYGSLAWPWSWQPVALGALAAGLWLCWTSLRGTGAESASADFGDWDPLWTAGRVLGFGLVVPIAEELAFRGYLLRRLQAVDFQRVPSTQFRWHALLISSALFGALHGANWLPGIVAGLLFALAVFRRGRLADAVIAHVTANVLLVLTGALSDNWRLLS